MNLGFAAQTERGLVVPVFRDAHTLTTARIATELGRLTDLARTGGLPPEALTGGTFTLNNYGVFGVDGSTPIINHPEAALLGVGRVVDKPWVVDGELAVRKVTQLSLSFDHRVCDGGVAGGFLRYVADCVERRDVADRHVSDPEAASTRQLRRRPAARSGPCRAPYDSPHLAAPDADARSRLP
ncbi:2-oxo acid dehydrogenase subunit E2 [Streptomyces sp. NPDC058357]|uniref:2-oxo acid dehydrogenase subunit E2 n=1 Tax=unclassified Streptomyces TaxID=2593676 RepID=UPI00364E02C3